MLSLQANPVHLTVPGMPAHLVFAVATLSPNQAINNNTAESTPEFSTSGEEPLSAFAGHGLTRRSPGAGDQTSFYFVVTPASQIPQGATWQQLYHGDDTGACRLIHTLAQVCIMSQMHANCRQQYTETSVLWPGIHSPSF
jgi:hypothetical protein